ncbi:hypothetical protein [Thalassotalea sp. Y01]|uniref:hypothetical protein n=1 Tax=Thalassotalea sp. Y01 TaxID=2729613 RepID=UPI00145CE59A|nr:hypothetical protein [Thalassotalea sp. Y01]NMP17659.1 hypothetical protein [Thalassotalea sp. Y01]
MQDLLSDALEHSSQFSELCSALYEREIQLLANQPKDFAQSIQARLKSLPHYIKQTAGSMLASETPLGLDLQNASWSEKQSHKLPLTGQSEQQVSQWYRKAALPLGLVVPVLLNEDGVQRIAIDCIDRVDTEQQRIRLNYSGWFELEPVPVNKDSRFTLLKPCKKAFAAACSGHQWRDVARTQPHPLSLRELLLSCQINWQNMRATASLKSGFFSLK